MIHSFLIIGQSNMAGRGNIHEAMPINDARLLVLRNGRWQHMYRPVNNDRPFSGVCLAERFAKEYAETKNVYTGIIPCADGGTTLEQWKEGTLLYDHAVFQAKLAQRTSTIAGVLWHQGEGDCREDLYPLYKEKISKIMTAFRRDLNLHDVPFIVGGLGDYLVNHSDASLKNYSHINKALKEYADETPMTGFVSAVGLESKGDNLHFSTRALEEFGLRYYSIFQKLENKDKIFEETLEMDFANRTEMEKL